MAIIAAHEQGQPSLRLSVAQQGRVWDGWFTSEVRAHYFADLAGMYRRYQTIITWATLMFSSSAVLTVLAKLPERLSWITAVLALATSALSFASVVLQLEKKATGSTELYFRWNELANEYRDLWENMYVDDAQERLARLDEQAIELGRLGTLFPVINRRMEKWYAVVDHNLMRDHATV